VMQYLLQSHWLILDDAIMGWLIWIPLLYSCYGWKPFLGLKDVFKVCGHVIEFGTCNFSSPFGAVVVVGGLQWVEVGNIINYSSSPVGPL
jgi:hypothetical protein